MSIDKNWTRPALNRNSLEFKRGLNDFYERCKAHINDRGAKIPKTYYEAKKSMKKVGLGYESIDACINDCCSFGEENKDEQICPTCKASRWKNKDTTGKKVPNKVLRYFPLIPRLKRMYGSLHTAKHMTWHATGKCTKDGKMGHPVDENNVNIQYSSMDSGMKSLHSCYMFNSPALNHLQCIYGPNRDFPARSSLSGWSGQGYLACPTCNDETPSTRVNGKTAYVGHRRFLPMKHHWRNDKTFNGKSDNRPKPKKLTSARIIQQLADLPSRILGKHPSYGGVKRPRDPIVERNWSKRSIFYKLPYWSSLPLKHNLDVMHIEKNVLESILGTLLMNDKSKDTNKARQDLEQLNIRPELWLSKKGNGKFIKPHPVYSFTPEKRRKFCEFIKGVKLPDGFGSNFKPKTDMLKPKTNRGYSRPEGCIAEGYIAEEALTFCSHYLRNVPTKFNHPDINDDGPPLTSELQVFRSACTPKSAGVGKKLDHEVKKKLVWYVLDNSPEIDQYKTECCLAMPENDLPTKFSPWFRDKISTLYTKNPSECSLELFAMPNAKGRKKGSDAALNKKIRSFETEKIERSVPFCYEIVDLVPDKYKGTIWPAINVTYFDMKEHLSGPNAKQVEKGMELQFKGQYRNRKNKFKDEMFVSRGGYENPVKMRNFPPPGKSLSEWHELCDHFTSEKHLAHSAKNKANRAKLPQCSTQGSKSYAASRHEEWETNGVFPDLIELYKKTHQKEGKWAKDVFEARYIKMLKLRASQEGLEEKMTDDEIMDKVLGSSRSFKPGRGRNLPKSTSSSSVCNYPSPEPLVSKSALRRFVEAHNQQMKDWHAKLADKNIELRLPAPLDPNALLEDDAEPRDAADVLEDAANVLEDAAEPGEE
ncbi:zinc finger, PHD-type containing protein [Tanacetum coccineum]|uniref:Zinc finger, PHD-type containing protein n=1 Tax=Tanacetum coccineum TaxID=301880 RepID=A0ABQ5G9G0_9ASTR